MSSYTDREMEMIREDARLACRQGKRVCPFTIPEVKEAWELELMSERVKEAKRKRREYYMRNRAKILAKQKAKRLKDKAIEKVA